MDWTVLETATGSGIFPTSLAGKSSFGVDNRANPVDPFAFACAFGCSLADEEAFETELAAIDVAISAPSGLTETIRTGIGLSVCEASNGGLAAEFTTTGLSTVVATAVARKPSIAGCGAPTVADVPIGGELKAAGCFSEFATWKRSVGAPSFIRGPLVSPDDATASFLGGWALIGSRVAAEEDKFFRKSETPPFRAKFALIIAAPAKASAEAMSFQLGERNCLASSS